MLDAVDLFAGCGGLSLGFQNAGVNIKSAFEFWDAAAACYEKNFNHPVHRVDLSDTETAIQLIKAYKPDLIIGGPPCQDFSFAGKRVEASRASLTCSYAAIICSIRPNYFVMENVGRAAKSNAYAEARSLYKAHGYGLTEAILDASKCGVPQKRKRFFCIGILGGEDYAVDPIIQNRLSKAPTTVRDYLGDELGLEFYYRHPRNYSRRAVFSIDEPAPTMRGGVNRPIPKGYPGHPKDACALNPSLRALTTAERALIQTFPKDFVWDGNKTATEQMIGNAVPVKLAEFVAASLLEYIARQKEKETSTMDCLWTADGFEAWLINEKSYSSRSAHDVLSRCRRSDKILPCWDRLNAYYLFTLQQQTAYQALSTSVKSQLKKAVILQLEYASYLNIEPKTPIVSMAQQQ